MNDRNSPLFNQYASVESFCPLLPWWAVHSQKTECKGLNISQQKLYNGKFDGELFLMKHSKSGKFCMFP